jgi:hypothetical protein
MPVRILDDFEYEDVSAMPKERLLGLLDADASKHRLDGPSPDLAYMSDFVLLMEKVKKHPRDDCAKFLAERAELLRKIETAKLRTEQRSKGEPLRRERSYPKDPGITRYTGPYTGQTPKREFGGFPDITAFPPGDDDLRTRILKNRSEPVMSFGPVVIGRDQTMNFEAMSQCSVHCTKLVIPNYVAPAFVIHDLRAGGFSMLRTGFVPAGAFIESAIGIAFSLNLPLGVSLLMVVQNISSGPATFTATIFGERSV